MPYDKETLNFSIDQIAEAFCRWRFAETYPYMVNEIKWNVVGKEELVGRAAIIDRCTDAAKFIETVTANLTKLKIHRAGSWVIVEGAAQFQDQENQTSSIASCDVFQFSDGRLVEITSYVIDLSKPLGTRNVQKGDPNEQ